MRKRNLTCCLFMCQTDLGLDIQDDMGRHEVGFKDNTVKTPVGDEGCRFESHFLINKVSILSAVPVIFVSFDVVNIGH